MPLASEPGAPGTSGPATVPQPGYESQANRQTSSFFDIPPVIFDKNYVDGSNTEVAWTPGYFDHIHFVPWNDFEKEVWSKGMKSFRDIPPDLSSFAKSMMDAARTLIAESNEEEHRIAQEAAELSPSEASSSEDESDETCSPVLPQQSDLGAFTNCASVKPMIDSVVLAVQSLLRASLSLDPEKRRHYVRCKNELEISTVKLTNSRGHNSRLSTPQNIKADVGVVLGVIKKGKKPKAPNSSASLSATSKFNVGGVLPLCTFEMKGPTLDMTGMTAIAKMEHSSASAIAATGQNSKEPPSNAEGSTDPDSQKIPVYTAKEVADAFNFLFSDSSFINRKKREGGPIRSSIFRIAQVVTYAILSLGQCSFLYNLQSGIGFHVVGSTNKKLTVEVTGVLSTDKSPNCGSAMYAIAKYCLDQYFADGSEGLTSKVRAVARKVSDKTYSRDSESSHSSDCDYSPGEEETNGSRSQHSSVESVDVENAERGEVHEATYSLVSLDLSLKPLRLRDWNVPHKVPSGALNENIKSLKDNRTIDVAIKNMFENFVEVVGSGSSAVVMKSKFMNMDVAVKVPFDSSLRSKQSVAHEIKTYLELHREKSPLLGDVLPRLILAWNSPERSSAYGHMVFLVIEYVGRGLMRNKRGQLCVGDRSSRFEVLKEQDEEQIRESAIEGLRKMHTHGILHCDVALRNLRAERIVNQSVVTWRTWWVDLGQSARSTPEMSAFQRHMECVEAVASI